MNRGSKIVNRGSKNEQRTTNDDSGDDMKLRSYKDLDVWKKGIEIVDFIYEVTNRFPKAEIYGLSSQMQRSAVSIPSNVAEGFARQHKKEFVQFCYIALGSCAELETQLIVAHNRRYVPDEDTRRLEEYLDHESRMLRNLVKSLKHNS